MLLPWVVAFGGSFGGYGALSALAFTPELYACGVSFFGPSDLLRFIRDYSALPVFAGISAAEGIVIR